MYSCLKHRPRGHILWTLVADGAVYNLWAPVIVGQESLCKKIGNNDGLGAYCASSWY